MSALAERLRAAKGDRSIDDIVKLAAREGLKIHRAMVAHYLKGEHGPRPRDATIAALAAGFGLDVRELRVLAGMPPGELEPYEPAKEAARLNREQRDALDQLIRAIVRGDGSDAQAKPAQKRADDGPVVAPVRRGVRRVENQPQPSVPDRPPA